MVVVGAAAFPHHHERRTTASRHWSWSRGSWAALLAAESAARGPETGDRILPGKRRANPGPAIGPDQAGQGREELTRA